MKAWIAALLIGCIFTPSARAQDGMLLGAADSDHATPTGNWAPSKLVTVPPTSWTTVTPAGSGWQIVSQEVDPLGFPPIPTVSPAPPVVSTTEVTVGPDLPIVPEPTDVTSPTPVIALPDGGSQPGTDLTTLYQSWIDAGIGGGMPLAVPPLTLSGAPTASTTGLVGGLNQNSAPTPATTSQPGPLGLDPNSIPKPPVPAGKGDFTSVTIISIVKGSTAGLGGAGSDLSALFGGKYLSSLVDMALKIADKI